MLVYLLLLSLVGACLCDMVPQAPHVPVTYGATLWLRNLAADQRHVLHSHALVWSFEGSSGQNSVTVAAATLEDRRSSMDNNHEWQILPSPDASYNEDPSELDANQPIRCGALINLRHVATSREAQSKGKSDLWLHSHSTSTSAFSGRFYDSFKSEYRTSPKAGKLFEVTAFDGQNAQNDWQVVCEGDFWQLTEPIRLKHIVTSGFKENRYLFANRVLDLGALRQDLQGQMEASAIAEDDLVTPGLLNQTMWIADKHVVALHHY